MQDINLTNLFNNNTPTLSNNMYTNEQYQDAVSRIQRLTYNNPEIVWGRQWRQILANTMPFVLKLINRGHNNFLTFSISTYSTSWITYDFEEFIRYNNKFNIIPEVYYLGVAYPTSSRHWNEITGLFQRAYHEPCHITLGRYIKYLCKVGALSKVCDSYVDLNSHYKYSSKYICSKDKLRELVSLFIHTFSSISTHSSILSTTITPITTSIYSLSSLGFCMGHFVSF